MDPQAVIRRRVARVLLFDDQDRLLLFHVRDPADPTSDPWWYLPGGGMDPGESPEEAARRELFEETGIEDAEIGPVVLERRGGRFPRRCFCFWRVAPHPVCNSSPGGG